MHVIAVGKKTEQLWLTTDILLTAWVTLNSTTEETATQKEQWFGNRWHGGNLQIPGEYSHSIAGPSGNGWFHKKT